jgi:hypothetical protein
VLLEFNQVFKVLFRVEPAIHLLEKLFIDFVEIIVFSFFEIDLLRGFDQLFDLGIWKRAGLGQLVIVLTTEEG